MAKYTYLPTYLDSVLCNKEEEISIELSSEKLE